jgi:ABC-type uncharacterized transport system permease subunit
MARRAVTAASAVSTRAAASAAIALGVAVLMMAATLALMDVDAGSALGAFWRGSFGTRYAIASATLVRAVPLTLAGLAVALAFRAGVFNIGAEGQLLAGAAVGAAVAGPLAATGMPAIVALPLTIVAGAAAGGGWAGIAAWLRSRFGVLEVISTILLNFVAINVVGFLVRGPLQEPTGIYPQTEALPAIVRLPVLIPSTRLHWGVVIALLSAVALWVYLRQTAGGFRLVMTGANPFAAERAGGIDVRGVSTRAFLLSGALAGTAGVVEVTGVTYALYENLSPGYGYTAIAVALLARLHPLGVVVAGVLFGALDVGASAMQRDAGVPSVLVHTITAVAILGVVAASRPAAPR